MEIKSIADSIVAEAVMASAKRTASGGLTAPKDYRDSEGFLCCGICHKRKEFLLEYLGTRRIVPSLCECEKRKLEAEEAERKEREEQLAISRNKATCIQDRALLDCTFERDDGSLRQLSSARKYVDTWPVRKANNDGLLLWGNVGTGKTFYAGCIANALIEQGVSVLMTNFAKVLNTMQGMWSEDKNAFVSSMMKYSLLIIDDFGIERNTEYALEQVYYVIDERYKSKLPLIVTTNLSLQTLKNPYDTAHQRIYDRVLSMCVPVKFTGPNHRKGDAERKLLSCREIFT